MIEKQLRQPQHPRGKQERVLRIIAGQWRGRKFRFPALAIRPTPDRVRETLFNWLQGRVQGARCLDLYAGSGALGLEALSRGAASVVFVEQLRDAVAALERLLHEWQAHGARVLCEQAQRYLSQTSASAPAGASMSDAARRAGPGFDLVFLDPPYASLELSAAAASLERGWLAPGARVYVEHAQREPLPALPATWRELRAGRAGEVGYHLFEAGTLSTPEGASP